MKDKQVLVVDDHPITRKFLIKVLEQLSVKNVLEAGNGAEALQVLAKETVSLILLDLTMPVMGGIELLQNLKKDEALKLIPVVMVTAAAEQHRVDEALALGADGCLIKPIAKQPLSEMLSRFLL